MTHTASSVNILGVSFKAHDRSACIVRDGQVVAAVEEERLNRDKHTGHFPRDSIFEVLRLARLTPDDIDLVAYGGEGARPIEPPHRRSRAQLASLFSTNVRLRNQEEVDRIRTFFAGERSTPVEVAAVDHETAHLASAALCSGFDGCTALAVDGYGDDRSAAVGRWADGSLELVASSPLRSSVGLVYGLTTLLLGLSIWYDEGKVTAMSSFPGEVPDGIEQLYEALMPLPKEAELQPTAEALLGLLDIKPVPSRDLRNTLHGSEVVRPSPKWRPERTTEGYRLRPHSGNPLSVEPLEDEEFRALWYVLRRSPSAHVDEVVQLAAPLIGIQDEDIWACLLPNVELHERQGVYSASMSGGLSLRLIERDHAVYSLCDGTRTTTSIAEMLDMDERDVRELVEFSPLCRTLWTGGNPADAPDVEGFAERAIEAFRTWYDARAVEKPPLGKHKGTFIDAPVYAAVRRGLLENTTRPAVSKALQRRLEKVLTSLATQAVELTGQAKVATAGGVFLNVLANMNIRRLDCVEDLFIQPAASDAGTCVGAALYVWHHRCREEGRRPTSHRFESVSLGPSYTEDDVLTALRGTRGITWDATDDMAGTAADLAAGGAIVGWFEGRMEFGPRALGNRSVLADPSNTSTKDRINLLLKGREWYQPFCPSLPLERAEEYLVEGREAPFMIEAYDVPAEKRGEIPAVVHVDGTTRPQTVRRELQPAYHRVLTELESHTGVPVVLNTSFNIHGEPIVCTPRDALSVLVRRGVDVLVIEGFVVRRNKA